MDIRLLTHCGGGPMPAQTDAKINKHKIKDLCLLFPHTRFGAACALQSVFSSFFGSGEF
jgi:hypothetical protein